MSIIRFPKTDKCHTWGRHGMSYSTGLSLDPSPDNDMNLLLRPFNTKGDVSYSCSMQIPITTIPELIEQLKDIHYNYRNNATKNV
jgi:hypothetical protein